MPALILGSSPRVRGKEAGEPGLGHGVGIIPAGAGKRRGRSGPRRGVQDHPRGCGEKWRQQLNLHIPLGSSPRVRGKGLGDARVVRRHGIIPAGAGKRRTRTRTPRACRDHPRGCGEKTAPASAHWVIGGSSPRVRGKERTSSRSSLKLGIIPAGAGKSGAMHGGGGLGEDHPRGCGEKASQYLPQKGDSGSSPRVRGKDERRESASRRRGIIPAGAGKSGAMHGGGVLGEDHPRGCGEKGCKKVLTANIRGSSPRVRGKGAHARTRYPFRGIIPAGAGKSGWRCGGPMRCGDHPRGCGEKPDSQKPGHPRPGSSPRVRGKDYRGRGGP